MESSIEGSSNRLRHMASSHRGSSELIVVDGHEPPAGEVWSITWCEGPYFSRSCVSRRLFGRTFCGAELGELIERAGWCVLRRTARSMDAVCPECWLGSRERRIERYYPNDLVWAV